MPRPKRLAAINAASRLRSAGDEDDDRNDVKVGVKVERDDETQHKYIPDDTEDDRETIRPSKRRRTGRNSTQTAPVARRSGAEDEHILLHVSLVTVKTEEQEPGSIIPAMIPQRRDPNHSITYHHPGLLEHPSARQALLSWFDSVSSARSMPWRKPWINPADYNNRAELRQAIEKRAYEVWISEIMLQQTRVSTVIDYWNRWMARWPTIHDLAAAEPDNVLSAWRGLGYYNRASRIYAAAVIVRGHPIWQGLIPADVDQLDKCLPGVGKYTAGAISAIVYGCAEPMVDGNVLRVLSRQLGIFGDVKSDSVVVNKIWSCARELVRQVARDGAGDGEELLEVPPSDRPGRWGQALMELGSTVCTPKPSCSKCPVTSTCRAYSEGYALAVEAGEVRGPDNRPYNLPAPRLGDIEDICGICDDFIEDDMFDPPDESDIDIEEGTSHIRSPFFTARSQEAPAHLTHKALATIIKHAKKYPSKKPKKQLGVQASVVCAIRRSSDSRYLLQRRPPKGLLANLWELPSETFPTRPDSEQLLPTAAMNLIAHTIIHDSQLLISPKKTNWFSKEWIDPGDRSANYRHIGELGIVPWTFSHLKLTMYVQLFELRDDEPGTKIVWATSGARQKWATREEIDAESMGTGMMKCWDLVKNVEDEGW